MEGNYSQKQPQWGNATVFAGFKETDDSDSSAATAEWVPPPNLSADLRPVWASECPHTDRPGLYGPLIRGRTRPWGAAGSSAAAREVVLPGPPAGCEQAKMGIKTMETNRHFYCTEQNLNQI